MSTDSPDTGPTVQAGQDIDGYFSTDRVAGREEAVELPADGYRAYLPEIDDPKLVEVRGMDYEEFAQDRYQAPFLRDLLDYWRSLYDEPFVGLTVDGTPIDGLYELPETTDPHSPRNTGPVVAAEALLVLLDATRRETVSYDITAPEWRAWSNPEFVVHRVGLRMEDQSTEVSEAMMALVRASLSERGYERVAEAMDLNGFLGDLVGLPEVMNNRSYWFSLFGTPDPVQPWGWQLFGHHVALNFVAVGGRDVIAPVFLGAEPALTEEHPPLFADREAVALRLAGSFDAGQRAKAIVFDSVLDPAMPEGRLHPADERHVAGAFRDNRVVPYEGINLSELSGEQQSLVREIVEDFHALLRDDSRARAMAEYDAHLADTWFSWYGATDGTQPFYFRVQSPVIIAELDHHAGVWLTNKLPARFHVHTTLRHPNGNDYGRALVNARLADRPTTEDDS